MLKVSIVLPTYNGERYIRESIDSILNQTYKDWELIIVNDCSTDNTINIIEEYAEKDKRIKIINNKKNEKLPKSLNIGFREAVGEYLTWTSDDNAYLDRALEEMVKFLEQNSKYQMVCAQMDFVDKNGNFMYKHVEYSDLLMFYNDCVGACFMYRNKVLREVGEYDTEKFCIEDYEYWMRIIKKYGSIGFLKETLYKYRKHEESLTDTKKEYIKSQLLKYRISEIDWILYNLQNEPELITRMYCEFIHDENELFFLDKASKVIPELKLLKEKEGGKKYIIWGAGNYGRRALATLKDEVYCFADKNPSVIGLVIDGVRVISYEEMLRMTEKEICIAVWDGKVFPLLKELYENNIRHCRLAQEFI